MATKKNAAKAATEFINKEVFVYEEDTDYIYKADRYMICGKDIMFHSVEESYMNSKFKLEDTTEEDRMRVVRVRKGWTIDDVMTDTAEGLIQLVKSKLSFDKAKNEARLVKVKEKTLKYLTEYFDLNNDTGALKQLVGDKFGSWYFRGLDTPWNYNRNETICGIIERGFVRIPCDDRKDAAEINVPLHKIQAVSSYKRGDISYVSFTLCNKTIELKKTDELSNKVEAIEFLWKHGYGN